MFRLASKDDNCVVDFWLSIINLALILIQMPLFASWFCIMIAYALCIFALSSVLFVLDLLTCGTLGGKKAGFKLDSVSYSTLV
jgi:hypothetical protein